MIVVDTSVWIDHIRTSNPKLLAAISEGLVLHHPFVTAELVLGSIPDREGFCAMLGRFDQIEPMETARLVEFVISSELYATGLGMVEAHLLASANEHEDICLWSTDKRLIKQAERLGIACKAD